MTESTECLNSVQCVSCGRFHTARYCNFCGEKVIDAKQRSVAYLLGELVESFTSVENRFFKSLGEFLIRPGSLELKFRRGQRVRFMKPITFFLLLNLFYVVFTPLSDFNVSFYDQINSQPYSAYLKTSILAIANNSGMELKLFAQKYNQIAAISSRSLIIISVPLLALFIAIIYRRKAIFFADHLVFSLYAYAWVMVWIVLAQVPSTALNSILGLVDPEWVIDSLYFQLLALGLAIYLLFASKRAYQLSMIWALVKLPFAILALFASHFIYRLVQLLITIIMI